MTAITDAEWQAIEAMLATWWTAPPWAEQYGEGYRLALARFPARHVADELERRLHAGEQFRPSAAALVAGITGGGWNFRPFEDAWALIEQAVHRVGCSIYSPDFPERHQAAIDWLAEQDPVVAAFAAQRGLCGPNTLGHEPVGDPEHGGATRHRIGVDYRDHVRRVEERIALGKPPVEPRMLVVRGSRSDGDGMDITVERLRPQRQIEEASS